jgi:hypothetical protein
LSGKPIEQNPKPHSQIFRKTFFKTSVGGNVSQQKNHPRGWSVHIESNIPITAVGKARCSGRMDSKPISFYGLFVPQVVRFSQVFLMDEAMSGRKKPGGGGGSAGQFNT